MGSQWAGANATVAYNSPQLVGNEALDYTGASQGEERNNPTNNVNENSNWASFEF